jgi:hypothetical protein
MPGSANVRGALERRAVHAAPDPEDAPPGAFRVDADRALDALRWAWNDAYAISVSRTGEQEWRAVRHGRPGEELISTTADDLNHLMRADWGLDQARLAR